MAVMLSGARGFVQQQRLAAPAVIQRRLSEAQKYRAAVLRNGGTLSNARMDIIEVFINAEKVSGAWSRTDDYMPLWGEDAPAGLTSLKQLRLATVVSAPTFTADRGYAFDGAANYVNSGFVPSTMAQIMLATDMRLAVYERTSLAAGTSVVAGTFDTGTRGLYMRTRHTGDLFQSSCNCTLSTVGTGITSTLGYFAGSRTTAPAFEGYKNGASTRTVSPGTTSSVMPTRAIYIGAWNNGGTASNFRATSVGLVAVGASLTAAQELAQYTAVQAWATAIGANV